MLPLSCNCTWKTHFEQNISTNVKGIPNTLGIHVYERIEVKQIEKLNTEKVKLGKKVGEINLKARNM